MLLGHGEGVGAAGPERTAQMTDPEGHKFGIIKLRWGQKEFKYDDFATKTREQKLIRFISVEFFITSSTIIKKSIHQKCRSHFFKSFITSLHPYRLWA